MLKKICVAPLLLAPTLLLSCASQSIESQVLLDEPALREVSGLAMSRLNHQQLWVLNDGGHSPTLYALDTNGQSLARLKVRGQRNRDWEDMASFSWKGKHWLVVADIGDNSARHKKYYLHFIEEPVLPEKFSKLKIKPKFSITFNYPDGPRDAEAIAFDPISEELLILSKRDDPGQLYSLSLPTLFKKPHKKHTAKALGSLPWDGDVPTLATLLSDPKRVVTHGMATALDISDDGLRAVILGYQQAMLLQRTAQQSWAEASITALPPHWLKQAESISFSHDQQSVYLSTEGRDPQLLQMQLP